MKFPRQTLILLITLIIVSFPAFSQESGKPSNPTAPVSPPLPAVEYNESAWKVFSPPDGQFTIKFPGTPTEKNNPSDTSAGRIENHQFTLKTVAVYGISYTEFPANLPIDIEKNAAIRKQLLDGVRDRLVALTKSKVLSEEDISVEGHPGRMTKLATGNGGITRIKFCVVGKRIYQITVTTPGETLAPDGGKFDETMANKFLDSFKLEKSGIVEKNK